MSLLIENATIKMRRDTLSNWITENPVPNQGEACYETDTGYLKIGNGINHYIDLPGISGGANWDENRTYNNTDLVFHNSLLYISLQNGNLGEEPIDGSLYWVEYVGSVSSNVPAFRVSFVADQLRSMQVAYIWDVVEENSGGNYNTVTGAFTAPQTGYYYFSLDFRAASAAWIGYYKNGVLISDEGNYTGDNTHTDTSTRVMYLETGDIVDIRPSSTASETLYNDSGWSGFLIGGPKGDKGDPGANSTAWNDTDTFSSGDIVGYDAQLYISLQNSNTDNQPDISPTWWINYTNALSNDVPSFSVVDVRASTVGPVGDLQFNYALSNNSNSFSLVTHVFTVPSGYDGKYFFTFDTMNNSNPANYQYKVNGILLRDIYHDDILAETGITLTGSYALGCYSTTHTQTGMSVVLDLDVGDAVGVYCSDSGIYWQGINHFSGFYMGGAKGEKGDAGIGNEWDILSTYTIDAIVSYGDTIYKSLQPGNIGNTPDDFGSLFWTLAYITNTEAYKIAQFSNTTARGAYSGTIAVGINTVPLNTEDYNTIDGCTFNATTHEFTLLPGLYEIDARTDIFYTDGTSGYLWNVTTDTLALPGKATMADQGGAPYMIGECTVHGILELVTEQTFLFKVDAAVLRSNDGFGWSGQGRGLTPTVWAYVMITDINSTKGEKGDPGANSTAWNNTDTFGTNDIVGYNGVLFISLQDNNINHQPDIETSWWVIYVSRISVATTAPITPAINDIWIDIS